ncbi:MAG: hypothetical protein K6G64_02925 [Eubacterium sp.]|nr:hypothetical protein [Eubacterium sp.]
MNNIVDEFMENTNIPETPNGTVRQIVEYVSSPESIQAMRLMTDLRQPALSGIVKGLEDRFAYSDFPLHRDAENKNAPHRRDIGWIVRHVMREFGYKPTEQMRIGKFSGSKYFQTAAVYEKDEGNESKYEIETRIVATKRF